MKNLYIFLVLFLVSSSAFAQRKVLGYPDVYNSPLSPYEDGNDDITSFIDDNIQSKKSNNNGWWVTVVQSGASSYESPNNSSKKIKDLKFGESYFVVEKKNGDWYHLITAIVDKRNIKNNQEDIGWVHQSNLLLWNEGLISPRTKIHLKALLLNRFDNFKEIPCDKKEIVKVYTSSKDAVLREEVSIYGLYFVYKKENGRSLLGTIPRLSRYDSHSLLGWVDDGRLADWNTRIAVEPNFTEEGYNDRKNNENLRICGFKDVFSAEACAKGHKENKSVSWARDPVLAGKNELAESDYKRYRGDFMRFPLLSLKGNQGGDYPYYRSAVCDEVVVNIKCVDGKIVSASNIPNAVLADFIKVLSKYQEAYSNFNIMFVVEGSADMLAYKNQIASLTDEIHLQVKNKNENAKVRFGTLVYKDIGESDNTSNLIAYQELTTDREKVKRFINSADFSNPNSNGDYPAQNYGIKKGIEVSNFSEYHTNVVIVIGNKGDFSQDRLLRMKNKTSKLLVGQEELSDLINKKNINILGIQCQGGLVKSYQAFGQNLRAMMLEAAKKNYNKQFSSGNTDPRVVNAMKKVGSKISTPDMLDPDDTDEMILTLNNGKVKGQIFRIPKDNQAISQEDFILLVSELTKKLAEDKIQLYNELEEEKYGIINPNGGFTPLHLEILAEAWKNVPPTNDMMEAKYELYNETYFPKEIVGAKTPAFSFVLFWPSADLRNYYDFISRIITDVSSGSSSDKRKNLKDAYCAMLDNFSGGDLDKDCSEYSIDEIFQIIQGVKDEGLSFNFSNRKISCIVDRNCMTDEQVESQIRHLVTVKSKLSELINGSKNEFIFQRGGEKFFWIKVEDVY